jgi:hypothetical protein
MPPVLEGVTFAPAGSTASASWSSLPANEWVTFAAYSSTNLLSVEASKAWLAAHGVSSLSLDDQPPGYQASWNVTLSGQYSCGLYLGSKNEATYFTQTFGG